MQRKRFKSVSKIETICLPPNKIIIKEYLTSVRFNQSVNHVWTNKAGATDNNDLLS